MIMKLINPTDLELDAAFAEKVAGWMQCERLGRMVWYDPAGGHEINPPRFTYSADLVLPWLEKNDMIAEIIRAKGDHTLGWRIGWRVSIGNNETNIGSNCFGSVLAKCIVIALLRAHGIEVEFTS